MTVIFWNNNFSVLLIQQSRLFVRSFETYSAVESNAYVWAVKNITSIALNLAFLR